jgi:hypothetical protein
MGAGLSLAIASANKDIVAGILLIDPPLPHTKPMEADEVNQLLPPSTPSLVVRANSSDIVLQGLVREQMALSTIVTRSDPHWFALVTKNLMHYDDPSAPRPPVYLISARDPLSHVAPDPNRVFAHRSCSEWMLSPNRLQVAEEAWDKFFPTQLVGKSYVEGDHFSIFSPKNIGISTTLIQAGADAIQAALDARNA